ncbi:MAG: GreA/GreB family elongation factor [Woeseiaceae bacterium]|jgi:transcription elongation factor GreB
MGRWKPPRQAGAPYITAAGYLALQDELKALWLRRRDVVAALSAAAAEGDRSENAEYIYRKKELGGIDRRIRYLQKRMPKLEIVRHRMAPELVFFGAQVTLSGGKSGEMCYRLVGEDEADPGKGYINIDSPLAKSLRKKRVGDEVTIIIDNKEMPATIEAINYDLED